jgi:hypothetical protein
MTIELVEIAGTTTGVVESAIPEDTAGWTFSAQLAWTDSTPKMAAMRRNLVTGPKCTIPVCHPGDIQ